MHVKLNVFKPTFLFNKPEDNKLTVVSFGTASGCVTCSTSSAAAESCTLSKRPPKKNKYRYKNNISLKGNISL